MQLPRLLILPRAEAASYLGMFVPPPAGPPHLALGAQSKGSLYMVLIWFSWRLLSAHFLSLGTE